MRRAMKNPLPAINRTLGGGLGWGRPARSAVDNVYEVSEDPAPAPTIARTTSSTRVIGPL